MRKNISFAQDVERLKDAYGLNDTQIAGFLDVTPTYLSKIRRGERNASAKLIRALEEQKERLASTMGQPTGADSGFPPEFVEFATNLGTTVGMTFSEFVQEVVRRFGVHARDEIKAIFAKAAEDARRAKTKDYAKELGAAAVKEMEEGEKGTRET